MDSELTVVRLGLLGFGSVGRALASILASERSWLREECRVSLVVTGVSTGRSGSRTDGCGLDLVELLSRAEAGGSHGPALDPAVFVATCPADVIVETLPLEPYTGSVATEATRSALAAGRSVVSANKGPVAHALVGLAKLASEQGVSYRYESTVADGLPVFNLIRFALPAAGIEGFTGLLNSTSSVVLDALAKGGTVDDAVASAQAMGIAEADPAYDLEGLDAAVKLAALSAAVWGEQLDVSSVQREPVDKGSRGRSMDAAKRGRRLVSLAELTRRPGEAPRGSVRLADIGPDHVMYPLSGTSLGLTITSRLLCPITISSQQPSVRDTAYGLLSDILSVAAG